ncbi:MAG: hypothetical protein E6J41_10770 [Chloroflexi bacterium]|nr:MAG: hypothetical protein E6J41_10770 [Chloroflexota bacterium]
MGKLNVRDFEIECGSTWPGYRADGRLAYEHCCAKEQGHSEWHMCMCGEQHAVDGADDDRAGEIA